MLSCFFVSDLHGKISRYEKLFHLLRLEKPSFLLMGGDLLPHGATRKLPGDEGYFDFTGEYLMPQFSALRNEMQHSYPQVLLIPGNDDPARENEKLIQGEAGGLWKYLHLRYHEFNEFTFFGYSFVPPTPFRLKDWEKYDIGPTLPDGAYPIDQGHFTSQDQRKNTKDSIAEDLQWAAEGKSLGKMVLMTHSPPYKTYLDRIDSRGGFRDPHVGSKAIRRFIQEHQPLVSLHGHIHESSSITGNWRDHIGRTPVYTAAYEGMELAVIVFPLEDPTAAIRILV